MGSSAKKTTNREVKRQKKNRTEPHTNYKRIYSLHGTHKPLNVKCLAIILSAVQL